MEDTRRPDSHLRPALTEGIFYDLELNQRKLEVYRAALEGALQDGVVTEREEEILARLRDELGISEEEEARIRSTLAIRAA